MQTPVSNTTFSPIFSNKLIPSKPTHRFSPSLITAARRLLANALLNDTSNAMFSLLSPSCIPLHSFNFTYNALFLTNNKSFIEILNKEPGAYDRWVARGNDTMLPEVPLVAFCVGSQFFVLTRQHVRMVVGDDRPPIVGEA
ncbi:hypothetical protein GIB67_037428 [Kingdonia uniflora]|uniref:Uncharacterized protein n=1 Tax=Kingdonia uniflora TaxID=39325 RepID=A0A7J7M8V8_9MAGN|nr:hypothetical protein GIB67_037428 [Kingdonia uniflora]